MPVAERERLWRRLEPLSVDHMPLSEPPRESRFGSPLKLSKVHWVRPEIRCFAGSLFAVKSA